MSEPLNALFQRIPLAERPAAHCARRGAGAHGGIKNRRPPLLSVKAQRFSKPPANWASKTPTLCYLENLTPVMFAGSALWNLKARACWCPLARAKWSGW